MTFLLSSPVKWADQIHHIVIILIFASFAIYFYIRLRKIDKTKETAPQEEKRIKLFLYGVILIMFFRVAMLFIE